MIERMICKYHGSAGLAGPINDKLDELAKIFDTTDNELLVVEFKRVPYDPEVVAISKLAKVEIAAEDYNVGGKEIDGKHYFTYDEAQEVQKQLAPTGWRLPTRSEWALICEEFGQKAGLLDSPTLYKNLHMGPTGLYNYSDGKLYNRATLGFWWSATRSSATYANYLLTTTTTVYPQYSNYRGHGFALRLVKDRADAEK